MKEKEKRKKSKKKCIISFIDIQYTSAKIYT